MSTRQTRILALVVAAALLGLLALWLTGEFSDEAAGAGAAAPQENESEKREAILIPDRKPDPESPLKEDLSANYLVGYGAGENPEKDLVLVKDVLDAFQYTIKVPDALPTGENREIVAALLGANAYRIRFVAPEAPCLNGQGEIVDRWGTPLYFHFVEASEVGIRSAGPDKKMWTADDVRHGEYAGETQ